MCLVPTEEKRALDTLELGLQMLVSHYGGVENKLWSLISGKATSTLLLLLFYETGYYYVAMAFLKLTL